MSLCQCVSLVSKHLVFRSYRGDFNHEELCIGGHEQSMWNVQISGSEDELSDIDKQRLFFFIFRVKACEAVSSPVIRTDATRPSPWTVNMWE